MEATMNIDRMQQVEACLRDFAANSDCVEVDMHNWNACALGIVLHRQVFKELTVNVIYDVKYIADFLGINHEEFHHIFGSPKFGEASHGKEALLERADRIHRLLNTYVTVEKLKEIKFESLEEMEV
jgi:hypothetical protein